MMAYTKTTWQDLPSTATPVNATNLNKIEQGIYNNSEDIATVNTNIGDLTNLETSDTSSLVDSINSIISNEAYSTSEIKTNKVWIDGKPIYRKVINIGNYSWTTGEHTFDHNISNIDTVIEARWFGYFSGTTRWYYNWDSLTTKNTMINSTYVIMTSDGGGTSFSKNYIILEYTKTTD